MEPDPDVLEMVRRQLDRDPPPSTEALYGRATRINEQIYGLSLRQFNATYVLRVKRERKQAEKKEKGRAPTASAAGGGGEDVADEEDFEPRPGGFLEAVREAEDGDEDTSEGGGGSDGDGGSGEASGGTAGPGRDGGTSDAEAVKVPLRDRIRSVLWRYAREVAGRSGAAGAVAAVEAVDELVEEIIELSGITASERNAA